MVDIVLGSSSMIGEQLRKILGNSALYFSHDDFDFTDLEDCFFAFYPHKINRVFSLSGLNGGIEFNKLYPFDIYYTTSQINLNILKCCEKYRPNKLITIVASCAYPDMGNKFLREDNIFQGECHPSVESHGYAKRMFYAGARQLYKQYGVKTINTALTNCYGPGDRFDLSRTKVVGAAVKRICDAMIGKSRSVQFFGSGKPQREIMHCRDAAECLVKLSESYDDYLELVNIGSDQEITIYDLVMTIKELVGYNGEIIWDTSKTDGQMRKKLDSNKMKKYISHEMIPLKDGLKETIDYYLNTGRFLRR